MSLIKQCILSIIYVLYTSYSTVAELSTYSHIEFNVLRCMYSSPFCKTLSTGIPKNGCAGFAGATLGNKSWYTRSMLVVRHRLYDSVLRLRQESVVFPTI